MSIKHVWAAEYNPCCYESLFGIISLHLTRATARTAVKEHKKRIAKEEKEMGSKIQTWQLWRVKKIQVFP